MDQIELANRILKMRFSMRDLSIHSLKLAHDAEGPAMYNVETSGDRYVVRMVPEGEEAAGLAGYAASLLFLAEHDYPAPRLCPADDGASVTIVDGWHVLVMSFVHGSALDYSPWSLRCLGDALGHLHSLGPAAISASPALPANPTWKPETRIPRALELLRRIESRTQPSQRDQHRAFREALEGIPSLAGIPVGLIHTDCFPGNALRLPDDRVALLNWDGAGLAQPVIDLGYTVLTCSTALPWSPEKGPNVPRVTAFVEGYIRHGVPESAELDALVPASRIPPAVMGAESFAAAVMGEGSDEQWKLWWARYNAAEATALLMRDLFHVLADWNANS